jgi:hypothetical protein
MTRFSLIATALVLGFVGAIPTVSLATEVTTRPNLAATKHAMNFQDRWLGQFGANARVEPLCLEAQGQTTQVLSPATCFALAALHVEPIRSQVRSVRVAQIKRDRALWNALSRRDQRILEQYEVVVVGNARAVEAKTGGPR